jgi:hypothetical protein
MNQAGIIIGYYNGFLYKFIEQALGDGLPSNEVNVKTSNVLMLLGLFEFFAGISSGYFLDR